MATRRARYGRPADRSWATAAPCVTQDALAKTELRSAWLIRALRLIGGSRVHRINLMTRIDHAIPANRSPIGLVRLIEHSDPSRHAFGWITAEDPAFAEDLVPQGVPDPPYRPFSPRYFEATRVTERFRIVARTSAPQARAGAGTGRPGERGAGRARWNRGRQHETQEG